MADLQQPPPACCEPDELAEMAAAMRGCPGDACNGCKECEPDSVIGRRPPSDGRRWEPCCARCGSSVHHQSCEQCGGDGVSGHDCGEDSCCCLDPEDNVRCDACGGSGGWYECLSSEEWCSANPLPGRENTPRGTIEWDVVPQ